MTVPAGSDWGLLGLGIGIGNGNEMAICTRVRIDRFGDCLGTSCGRFSRSCGLQRLTFDWTGTIVLMAQLLQDTIARSTQSIPTIAYGSTCLAQPAILRHMNNALHSFLPYALEFYWVEIAEVRVASIASSMQQRSTPSSLARSDTKPHGFCSLPMVSTPVATISRRMDG